MVWILPVSVLQETNSEHYLEQYLMHGLVTILALLLALFMFSIIYAMKEKGAFSLHNIRYNLLYFKTTLRTSSHRTKRLVAVSFAGLVRRMKTLLSGPVRRTAGEKRHADRLK